MNAARPSQHNQSHSTTSQPSSLSSDALSGLAPLFRWDSGGLLLGCLLLTMLMSIGGRKRKLVFGRRAGVWEKLAAVRQAEQQRKLRQRNRVSLYVGTPRNRGIAAYAMTLMGQLPTLYVPNANEGIVVCGGPGKGKSFSGIDPMIRSSIDQGFATIIYDFKGEQLRRHIAYAVTKGYEVAVFAPGFDYSAVCNPLDFLEDATDSTMAKQFAITMNRNSKAGESSGRQDEYFKQAGDLLVQSILMLAKGSPYSDLTMVWAILSCPDLARRMLDAQAQGELDTWASIGATALTSVAHAEQTGGGIISTAVATFAPLMDQKFLACLCGKTTLPMKLVGKRLIIFQLEQRTRDVVAPIVATILNLLVVQNLSVRRTEPLVLAMDEFPTLYLQAIMQWANEYRENGLALILGYQNYAQLEGKYGKEMTQGILAACATQFVFNPQDETTAERYSKYFGEEEVIIRTKSRNHGKSSGTGHSEQYHKRPVFDARFFLTLPRGKCVFVNPAYQGRGEAAIPFCLDVKIPPVDEAAQQRSEELWDRKLQARLIERCLRDRVNWTPETMATQLRERFEFVDQILLPMPEVANQPIDPIEKFESTTFEDLAAGVENW